jgi:pimeloyl-ACP methyl ester carboxylesterase
MQPQGIILLFLALLFFGGATASSQQPPAAIVADPAPDIDFPAAVESPDILSHGARLNAVFFIASGAGPHPAVLLLHGFPGNEKNLDLAYMLRRAGWNVLVPHYRGSWGSVGNFSFANAIEDTEAAIAFLRDPANVKKYRINPKKVVLIGHSMGGFLAANAAAHDPDVYAVSIMAAWNLGAVVSRPSLPSRTDSFVNASPRLTGTTPEGLIAEAKEHAAQWNYVDYAGLLKTRPVLILEAKDPNKADNQAMADALRKVGNSQVVEKFMETDHSFSDHRIALQIAILEWLQCLPAPGAK